MSVDNNFRKGALQSQYYRRVADDHEIIRDYITTPDSQKARINKFSILIFADAVNRGWSPATSDKSSGNLVITKLTESAEAKCIKTSNFFTAFFDKLGNALMGRTFISSEKYLEQVAGKLENRIHEERVRHIQFVASQTEELAFVVRDGALNEEFATEKAPNYSTEIVGILSRLETKDLAVAELPRALKRLASAVINSQNADCIEGFQKGILAHNDAKSFWEELKKNGMPDFPGLDDKLK